MLNRLTALWNYLDPKLRVSVATLVVSYLATRFAIQLDADTSALVAAVIASYFGYRKPNAGSELRENPRTFTAADSGGLDADGDLAAHGDELAPVGEPIEPVEPDDE